MEAQGGAEALAIKSLLQSASLNGPAIKLWLDADHLSVREEVSLSLSISGVSESGDMVVDFSHDGGAITVSIPAASTVETFSQFEARAASAGSNSPALGSVPQWCRGVT